MKDRTEVMRTKYPPLRNKWVFKIKINADGTLRYKARVVVKGYEQQAGRDYEQDELYAPVAKFVSIRALFALAAVLDWEIMQLDVKTAFLYPDLQDEIYMELSEGYDDSSNGSDKVCRLLKSMYGLKQALRAWYANIDEYLVNECRFVKCQAESNLYVLPSFLLFLILYVDDILIFCQNKAKALEIRDQLLRKYKMTDLGLVQQFLGLQIVCNHSHKQLLIHQAKYIEEFLRLFNQQSCNSVSVPMEPSVQLPQLDPDAMDTGIQKLYQGMVGKLMYGIVGM